MSSIVRRRGASSPPRRCGSSSSRCALIAAYIGAQLAVAWARGLLPGPDRGLVTASGCGLASVLLLLLYAALVRVFERRRPSELALRPGAGLAVAGAAGGFLLFALVLAALFGLGLARLGGGGDTAQLAPMAVAAVFAAVGEELAIRGGVFRVLEEGLGSLAALVLSASLFGLLHAANTGATPVSTAAIAVEAGLLLGAAYMATRNLWLPIGLHFGWNFTEGGIFGAAVSGGRSHGALAGFDPRPRAPERRRLRARGLARGCGGRPRGHLRPAGRRRPPRRMAAAAPAPMGRLKHPRVRTANDPDRAYDAGRQPVRSKNWVGGRSLR